MHGRTNIVNPYLVQLMTEPLTSHSVLFAIFHKHHEHPLSCPRKITSSDGIDILPAIDVVSLKVRYNY